MTERIQGLNSKGFVSKERYGGLSLTDKGMDIAEWLTWKHRVIEVFLHDILKLDISKIHEEANKLEHAFSDEAIGKLYNFLTAYFKKEVLKDPHGQPLPIISNKPY